MVKAKHILKELSVVAIVGRPNVGKSTLVNRLSSGKSAIVDVTSGVTRDRNFIESDWRGKSFFLVDTGGIDFTAGQGLQVGVTEQSRVAAMEADLIIHVVDGRQGPTGDDQEIASMLRSIGTPVILAVNKIDGEGQRDLVYDFFALSEGDPEGISAQQGLGIGELLDRIVENLPPTRGIEEEDYGISVAIVGKPNVGKSQLLNKIVGFERVLVSEIPGTTRDAIHTSVEWEGKKYLFIDTAGLRRKATGSEALEYYSLVRTVRAMDMAEIAVLLIDASEGITDQDQRISRMVTERKCALVAVFNKWDLVGDGLERSSYLREEVSHRMNFLNDPRTVTASALTGHHLKGIFKAIDDTHADYTRHVKTADLNGLIAEIEHQPPAKRGKRLRIYYAAQMENPPPAFVFFVNNPALADDSFIRYLENKLRKAFRFEGCPIKIIFRRKQ